MPARSPCACTMAASLVARRTAGTASNSRPGRGSAPWPGPRRPRRSRIRHGVEAGAATVTGHPSSVRYLTSDWTCTPTPPVLVPRISTTRLRRARSELTTPPSQCRRDVRTSEPAGETRPHLAHQRPVEHSHHHREHRPADDGSHDRQPERRPRRVPASQPADRPAGQRAQRRPPATRRRRPDRWPA